MYDDVIAQIEGANHMTPAETQPMVVENLRNGTCDIITYSMLSAPKLLEVYPDLVVLDMEDAFEDSLMPDNAGVAKETTPRSTRSTKSSPPSTTRSARTCGPPAWIASRPNGRAAERGHNLFGRGCASLHKTPFENMSELRLCACCRAADSCSAAISRHSIKGVDHDHRIGGRGSAWPLGPLFAAIIATCCWARAPSPPRVWHCPPAPSLFELHDPCICA
ncbi:MAG: hypothetical protein ACLTKG_03050 [Collinsella intestinalis]